MRWFFILLLVTNAAFFSWQMWLGQPAPVHRQIEGAGLSEQGLVLLSELTKTQQPKLRQEISNPAGVAKAIEPELQDKPALPVPKTAVAEDATQPVTAAASSMACYRSNEMDSAEELESIAKVLTQGKPMELKRESVLGTRVNYWVMLPPYGSREKADEAAKMLLSRKVKDFFIVRSGQFENAVSLGVYSTKERAQRRVDEIAKLKLRLREPRIDELGVQAKRFYLRFTAPDADAKMRLEKLAAQFPEAQFEKIDCK